MLNARSTVLMCCLAVVLGSTSACVVHRQVQPNRPKTANGTPKPLLTATKEELVQRLIRQYDAIKSFNATVDLTPATGSVYKGEITEYQDIRAYVLYRKPADIRIIGLAPVVRTKVFDMVSMGTTFRISLPTKNKFVEGRNDAPATSKNSLENLRPEALLDSMLVRPPDPATEIPVLIDATDEESALYILVLIGKTKAGELTVSRTIFFDRNTLNVVRQRQYNSRGEGLSDTRYKDWTRYGTVLFPNSIDINRPIDGYGAVMNVVKLDMNAVITDDKFVLNQPEGSQLQVIGAPAQPPASK